LAGAGRNGYRIVNHPYGEPNILFSRFAINLCGLTAFGQDVEMPVMDGLTCTRQIRRLEQTGEVLAHVPIVAVSANARNEQIGEAMNSGMDDTIAKPFRILDLLPKIDRWARRASTVPFNKLAGPNS
jgi:PleD family two-component response regulator